MWEDMGMFLPDKITGLRVRKVLKDRQHWGYSIKLYKHTQYSWFNIPLHLFPSDILNLFSLVDVIKTRIRKDTNGTDTLEGKPFEVCTDEKVCEVVFSFIYFFGYRSKECVPDYSTFYYSHFSINIMVKLSGIVVEKNKKKARVVITSNSKVSIEAFIKLFKDKNINVEFSHRQVNPVAMPNYEFVFFIPLVPLFNMIVNNFYVLAVAGGIPVLYLNDLSEKLEGVASTSYVGGFLVDSNKNVPMPDQPEVYKWLGGETEWSLLLERLRLNYCLVYYM